MRCAIWCHWFNFKNVEKQPWRSVTLVKLQVKASNFTKSSSPSWVFFTFLKLYKWYLFALSITY